MKNLSFSDYSRKRIRTCWIVWSVCIVWSTLCVVSAFRVTHTNLNFEFSSLQNPLVIGFLISSIFSFIAAYFIPKMLKSSAEKRSASLIPPAFAGFVVRQILVSYVVGTGFAVAVQLQNGNSILVFFALSLLGFSFTYPKRTALELTQTEFDKMKTQANEVIKVPLVYKTVGLLLIAVGFIMGFLTSQEYIRHAKEHIHTGLKFANLGDKFFILGLFIIFGYRLKIKSPKKYWVITGLLSLLCVYTFITPIIEGKKVCREECVRLYEAKQLKAGMDQNACFVEMCENSNNGIK